MKPSKQLNRHDPENGVWGDCTRTVFACLLDLEPADVPHFYDKGENVEIADRRIQEWLGSRYGLRLFQFPLSVHPEAENGRQAVLDTVGSWNRDAYWTLSGKSKRGTNHVVICCGSEIVWDPSLDNTGIVGPVVDGDGETVDPPHYTVAFLMPASQHRR